MSAIGYATTTAWPSTDSSGLPRDGLMMKTQTSRPSPVEIVMASTRLAHSRRALRRTMSRIRPATTWDRD